MKIAFYSPYIPKHFGGGEKHFFDVASYLANEMNYQVDVLLASDVASTEIEIIKNNYQKFLNYSLEKINFLASPFPNNSFLEKLFFTKKYDYFYYVTDGSLFFSLAKNNILHLQIPFLDKKNSFLDRLKLLNWSSKNANSLFTKNIIEKNWQTKIDFLLYPKVSFKEFENNQKKEKIILNVGRFFKQLHSKRQDILINIFKKMFDENKELIHDYKLVLIGQIEDQNYFDELQKMAKGYPIYFETKLDRKELVEFYKKSKIYWHGTGFGIDEYKEPEKVEHFGITTIEAVSAGMLPIVHKKGGQKEIIGNISELFWLTEAECITKTLAVIEDENLFKSLYTQIKARMNLFEEKSFNKTVRAMFE